MRMTARRRRGQALVEFALVFPLFMLLLFSIITLGLYVFYNQQLESATREAARYAAIHSSTAQCPTVGRIDPVLSNAPQGYFRCDAPEDGWPRMTGAARSAIWGMAPSQVTLAACWSGLVDDNLPPNADVLATNPAGTFRDCTIRGVNPKTNPNDIACPAPSTISSPSAPSGGKADGDDKASDIAVATSTNLHYPTTVTVYTCFVWRPPMAGFVFIPSQITLRSVVTEGLQRQQ
jgi:hypothetical protein